MGLFGSIPQAHLSRPLVHRIQLTRPRTPEPTVGTKVARTGAAMSQLLSWPKEPAIDLSKLF